MAEKSKAFYSRLTSFVRQACSYPEKKVANLRTWRTILIFMKSVIENYTNKYKYFHVIMPHF